MRLASYLAIAVLLLVPAVATAQQAKGEQLLTLDLTSVPGGKMYYLKCNALGAIPCLTVGIWTQTNELRGLQTTIYGVNGNTYEPDKSLLS